MQKITKMFLCAALALFSTSCGESQEAQPIDKLGARLVAYDEDGTEKTVFEANTNITLGLSLVSKSGADIDVGSYFDYCDLFQQEEFLLVYKLIKDDNGEEKRIPYGKPYVQPAPCPTIPVPVIVPAHGEAKLHGGAWHNNPENSPFTAGKYYTAFSFTLELDGRSRKHDLKLEFEVK